MLGGTMHAIHTWTARGRLRNSCCNPLMLAAMCSDRKKREGKALPELAPWLLSHIPLTQKKAKESRRTSLTLLLLLPA